MILKQCIENLSRTRHEHASHEHAARELPSASESTALPAPVGDEVGEMSKILHLDYETRSTCDLKKCGLSVYSKNPTTDVWCAAYAFDDEDVKLWTPNQPCPKEISDHIQFGGDLYAHNAAFEIAITNNICAARYGWPEISLGQVHCTMAMAFSMGVPGSLEKSAAAMGIDKQKDMAGSRLMMQMSQPREVSPPMGLNSITPVVIWWDDPEKLKRLYEYCIQDIEVERALTKRLLKLSAKERTVWQMDQEINNRGIEVDIAAAKIALDMVEKEKERLDDEMRKVSGNQIATCKAVAQITRYLRQNSPIDFALRVDSIGKSEVYALLSQPDIPADCRKILLLRQEAAKSSTAKLEAMIYGTDYDGRLRGCFQYYGAYSTGRWAGRRVQLQNLPRPKLKQNQIDEILARLSSRYKPIFPDEIDLFYGPPLSVISDCLRGFLTAKPGHTLFAVDFNAIEARVLAWLAGEEWILDLFREGEDIYAEQAARIFRVRRKDVTEEQRQVGKVAILALGYQGGVMAFQSMAKNYSIKISDAEAKSIKYAWRDSNTRIVSYWMDMENSARQAILNPGQKFKCGAENREVTYLVNGSFLFCQLPSKRVLSYPYPKVASVPTPWGASKEGVTYMGEHPKTHKWERLKTYGGSLAENATQAVARDLLVESMLRLRDQGYNIVMHVHDEAVFEVPDSTPPDELENIMHLFIRMPDWARDLPMAGKAWVGKRFRK